MPPKLTAWILLPGLGHSSKYEEDVNKKEAKCAKHGKPCKVPHADIIIAGTSCKDVSRASSSYSNKEQILSMEPPPQPP